MAEGSARLRGGAVLARPVRRGAASPGLFARGAHRKPRRKSGRSGAAGRCAVGSLGGERGGLPVRQEGPLPGERGAQRAARPVPRARAARSRGARGRLFAARNLTGTPLGDDHALVVLGDHAAFATFVYGQEQTVTWLDLGGERTAASGPDDGLADRVTNHVTRFEETGSFAGIARVEVSLVPPARAVGLTLGPRDLTIDLVDDAGRRSNATLDGDRVELAHASSEMHADLVRRLPKRFVLWAVDTVRAWVGPAPIAWLEEHIFAAKDSIRRAVFQARGGHREPADVLAEPQAQPAPAAALDASQAGGDGVAWPPPAVPSIWKTKETGEGEWQEPRLA